MKKKLISCLGVFIISVLMGMRLGFAAPLSQINTYIGDYGNMVFRDQGSGSNIFTIQSSSQATYSDGLYIANDQGSIELPITEAYSYANGYAVAADGTTTPGLATNDGCPSLVWASTETTQRSTHVTYAVGWTFTVPRDFRDGTDLILEIDVTTASGSSGAYFEYCIFENKDATAVDTAGTGVPFAVVATDANTKMDVLSATDTPDDVDAGDVLTVRLYITSITTGNVELKGARIRYPRQFNN